MELQLLAYTIATATQDPSRVCDLHHSSWQCQILNPLSEARDRTLHLMVPSWIHFCSEFWWVLRAELGRDEKNGKFWALWREEAQSGEGRAREKSLDRHDP